MGCCEEEQDWQEVDNIVLVQQGVGLMKNNNIQSFCESIGMSQASWECKLPSSTSSAKRYMLCQHQISSALRTSLSKLASCTFATRIDNGTVSTQDMDNSLLILTLLKIIRWSREHY